MRPPVDPLIAFGVPGGEARAAPGKAPAGTLLPPQPASPDTPPGDNGLPDVLVRPRFPKQERGYMRRYLGAAEFIPLGERAMEEALPQLYALLGGGEG